MKKPVYDEDDDDDMIMTEEEEEVVTEDVEEGGVDDEDDDNTVSKEEEEEEDEESVDSLSEDDEEGAPRKAVPSIRFGDLDASGGGGDVLSVTPYPHTEENTETESIAASATTTPAVKKKAAGQGPVAAKDRITKPFLTKYEKTRIIATRAQQIANGSLPLVEFDPSDAVEAVTLATAELTQKKTPLIVRRNLPNGTYEDWKVEELEDLDPDAILRKKKM